MYHEDREETWRELKTRRKDAFPATTLSRFTCADDAFAPSTLESAGREEAICAPGICRHRHSGHTGPGLHSCRSPKPPATFAGFTLLPKFPVPGSRAALTSHKRVPELYANLCQRTSARTREGCLPTGVSASRNLSLFMSRDFASQITRTCSSPFHTCLTALFRPKELLDTFGASFSASRRQFKWASLRGFHCSHANKP